MNSQYKASLIRDNKRYIVWPDASSKNPKVLTTEDWISLIGSTALFARKFDDMVDSEITTHVLENVQDRVPDQV
jgi:hypothetical protein